MSTVAELDALIDELTADAYDDEEQLSGFHAGAEEGVRRGEPATIVGADVQVGAVDCGPHARTGLLARARRNGALYDVALADLTLAAGGELAVRPPPRRPGARHEGLTLVTADSRLHAYDVAVLAPRD